MRRLLAAAAIAALVAGCAAAPAAHQSGEPRPRSGTPEQACGKAAEDVELHLKLVQQMQDKGLFHAALAHLDAADERGRDLPETRYLRAESLRQIGRRAEAKAIYEGLADSCAQGLAYRGLGLLAAQEGRIDEAVDHLRAASRALPIDPRVRNDLGYALLLQGAADEARMNFMTALELGGDRRRVTANMVLLLLVVDDDEGARKLADEAGIGAKELASIRIQAQEMRRKHQQDSEISSDAAATGRAEPRIADDPEPEATDDEAPTEAPEPEATDGQAPSENPEPEANDGQASTESPELEAIDDQALTESPELEAIDDQAPTESPELEVDDGQSPATSAEAPAVSVDPESAVARESVTSVEPQAVDHDVPVVSVEPQDVGDAVPVVNVEPQDVGDAVPVVNVEPQVVNDEVPAANVEPQVISGDAPIGDVEQGTADMEPPTGTEPQAVSAELQDANEELPAATRE